jgi:RNA recognition motif-containing protein
VTKEELEGVFKSYGSLKDTRIVTYRNGHSKGLAYVEFYNEVCNFIEFFFSNLNL